MLFKLKLPIIFLLILLLVFIIWFSPAEAVCQRQLVTIDNDASFCNGSQIWGVSYDESTDSMYLQCWVEAAKSPVGLTGRHILKAIRVGTDYGHFVFPSDQSELNAINNYWSGLVRDPAQPSVINTAVGRYLFFVTGSGLPSASKIQVAKFNNSTGRWEVRVEDQFMLDYINTAHFEGLPKLADNGYSIYFTSDYNRPCDQCACDNYFTYLEGSCFGLFKYIRFSLTAPFIPVSQGTQILNTGYVNFIYLRNIMAYGTYFTEYSRMAAGTISNNNWFFFNGPPRPGKIESDFDNIYQARWDGEKFVDGYNMRAINDIIGEPFKENPDVTADGNALYWSSGPKATDTKLYYLNLTAVADMDLDGFNDCVDCNDSNAAIHPGAADICSDGIDQDCSGFDAVYPNCPDINTPAPPTGVIII